MINHLFEQFVILVVLWAIVLAINSVTAASIRHYRAYKYQQFEHRAAAIARKPDAAEQLQRTFWDFVSPLHEAAIDAQRSYNANISKAASSAALAVVALAISFSPLGPHVERLLASVETISLGFIVWYYVRGRAVNKDWVNLRSQTELLRQSSFLAVILLVGTDKVVTGTRIRELYETARSEIANRITANEAVSLTTQIQAFWSEKKAKLAERQIDVAALPMYTERRAKRQLDWFATSKNRLEDSARLREAWLRWLFIIVGTLAAAKLVLVHLEANHSLHPGGFFSTALPYIGPLSLLATGAAAAATAYYFNQNARSLIHRYNTQHRTIDSWLTDWNGIPANDHAKLRSSVLSFEDLMIGELIDWLRISSHDVIELA